MNSVNLLTPANESERKTEGEKRRQEQSNAHRDVPHRVDFHDASVHKKQMRRHYDFLCHRFPTSDVRGG